MFYVNRIFFAFTRIEMLLAEPTDARKENGISLHKFGRQLERFFRFVFIIEIFERHDKK